MARLKDGLASDQRRRRVPVITNIPSAGDAMIAPAAPAPGSARFMGLRANGCPDRTGSRNYEEGGLSHVRHAYCARVLPG